MKAITIEARLENVDSVLNFVDSQLQAFPPKIRNQIAIAVDEVFSNIARYAYYPNAGSATIRIAAENDIAIEFEDSGTAYNPLGKEDPDVSLSAEEREVGGLGIFLVKNIMDSVEYRYNNGKNILTIKKQL